MKTLTNPQMKSFQPAHINARKDDIEGNNGLGRYILLPGSDGRAQTIADNFASVVVKSHPRGHHLYLGTLNYPTEKGKVKTIDVATVSSGMGCASMEIILHELHHLGAKRFLRIGTAGSLQALRVKIGDIINVQAAVRDERTTLDYAPLAVPAVASFEVVKAVEKARSNLKFASTTHVGTVHCKSSFYAREYYAGPKSKKHMNYMQMLKQCGVLATEMETAALFIQSQIYNQMLQEGVKLPHAKNKVLYGAILGIIALPKDQYASADETAVTIDQLIMLGIETVKILAAYDDHPLPGGASPLAESNLK